MSEVEHLLGRELPSHWQLKTMGEVAKVVGGSTPKSKEPSYWDGDIPWIAVSDLTGYEEKFIERGARLITQAGYDSCPTALMPAGAVLFSSRAPIGYVAIAANDVCTSQGFKSFVLNDEVIPDFVYWWLHTARPLAEAMAGGTTFKELSGKAARQIPIPIPPLDEQRTIVAAVDRLVQALGRANSLASEAEETVPLLRVSVLRSFWNEAADAGQLKPLEDVVEILDKHRVPVNREEREQRLGPIPYYGATGRVGWIDDHLFDEELVLLGEDGVSFLDPFAQKAYRISGKSWVNNHAHVLRPREGVRTDFLTLLLNAVDYDGLVGGTTRLKLTQAGMKRLTLPVVDLDTQASLVTQAAAHLAQASNCLHALEQARSQSELLRASILAAAFTGALADTQIGDTRDPAPIASRL